MAADIWVESFDYFRAGNRFAGSSGPFSFKIFPQKDEDVLRVVTWCGPFCCEKTEETQKETAEFDYSQQGLADAVAWITEKRAAVPEAAD